MQRENVDEEQEQPEPRLRRRKMLYDYADAVGMEDDLHSNAVDSLASAATNCSASLLPTIK